MNLKLSNLKIPIEGNDFSYPLVNRKLHPSAGANVEPNIF